MTVVPEAGVIGRTYEISPDDAYNDIIIPAGSSLYICNINIPSGYVGGTRIEYSSTPVLANGECTGYYMITTLPICPSSTTETVTIPFEKTKESVLINVSFEFNYSGYVMFRGDIVDEEDFYFEGSYGTFKARKGGSVTIQTMRGSLKTEFGEECPMGAVERIMVRDNSGWIADEMNSWSATFTPTSDTTATIRAYCGNSGGGIL